MRVPGATPRERGSARHWFDRQPGTAGAERAPPGSHPPGSYCVPDTLGSSKRWALDWSVVV